MIAADVMASALCVTLCDRVGVAASVFDARAQDVRGGKYSDQFVVVVVREGWIGMG